MAHKKGQGSVKNGRDSISKRLGVKKFGGESVIPGNIILRQRGTKFVSRRNVGLDSDYTVFALVEGRVKHEREELPMQMSEDLANLYSPEQIISVKNKKEV